MKKLLLVLSVMVFVVLSTVSLRAEITLGALLDEMVDRSQVAKFPEPAFTCKQFSSYDRASKSPAENWFANNDTAQFLREETNGGRKEWVMMDAEGPGAIVRWWITAPHYRTTIRIYIDGNPEPVIAVKADELIGGNFLADSPLSAEKARGRNLYLPIPYEKSVKVTADIIRTGDKAVEQGNLYYQINYRTYSAGTKVKSFTMEELKAEKEKLNKVQKFLADDAISFSSIAGKMVDTDKTGTIKPNENLNVELEGQGAIQMLSVKLNAGDIAQALRSTVLKISFDAKEDDGGQDPVKVFCPIGDFFGSGVGLNPYRSWYSIVAKDRTMVSLWVMPFKKNAKIELVNFGTQDVDAEVHVVNSSLNWTGQNDFMYFHCNWRQQREIPTRPMIDWEYIKLEGQGVFVGDVLSVMNRQPEWWGEGDEKIYVDGEKFPSHFGTGTEDYYGYAWCTPKFFEAPFHGQPRAEGPSNYGHATNLRVRSLDAIPFNKDFRFDMEVWHWHQSTTIDYAVATFWYGKPGAKAVGAPDQAQVIAEAKSPVVFNSPKFMPRVKGFVFKDVPPGNISRQNMKDHTKGNSRWKEDHQLWWTGTKPGDKMNLLVKLDKSGPQKLICSMTKAIDYGTVQFLLDGKKIGEPIDLFNNGVISTGDVVVGEVDAAAGEHTLTVEIVGKNEKSTNYMFGTDAFRFE